jgi:putative aldouronate transport system substrate-binding protein
MKRFALLLALMMVLSATDACTETGTPSAPADQPATTSADGREMVGNMYVTGLPLVQEQEELSILIDESRDATDVQNWPLIKKLEEETNVKVNWEVYDYDTATERKNSLLNSGDYPDMIGGWLLGGGDIGEYGSDEGIFIPLEELFAQYAPNINEALALTNVQKNMTLPDGHIYSPPYPIPEPQCFNAPYIYKPWLDKLGLEMPTTTEELKQVLIAFRDNDPNGNGLKDEIPLGNRADRMHLLTAWFGYPAPNGAANNLSLTMIDGKPQFAGNMDFVKDAINYLADLYAEGLLDPEVFTQDMVAYQDKGKQLDTPIYGVAVVYGPNDISPGTDAETGLGIRNGDYVPLPPLTSPTSSDIKWNRGSDGVTLFKTQLVITDNCDNPATAVRWIDNLYSPENSAQAQFGMLGVSSKYEDGVYSKIDPSIAYPPEFIASFPRFIRQNDWDLQERNPSDAESARINAAMDAAYANNMVERTPGPWYTAEESTRISTLSTDLGMYMQQKWAQWITGVADVNAEWDEYKAQLETLGLAEYVELITNAINNM